MDWFSEEDSDEDQGGEKFKPEEESSPNLPIASQTNNSKLLLSRSSSGVSELMNDLIFKCKMGLLLSTSIFQLALLLNKFSLLSEISSQLIMHLSIWNWSIATVTENQLQQNLDKLDFQAIKNII